MVIISLSLNRPLRLRWRCSLSSRKRFFAHSDAKFLQNLSIIQKISITLSSVITAYILVSYCRSFINVRDIYEITNFYEIFLIPNWRNNQSKKNCLWSKLKWRFEVHYCSAMWLHRELKQKTLINGKAFPFVLDILNWAFSSCSFLCEYRQYSLRKNK